MGGLCSVVKAVSSLARLAAKGEKVELVAVCELTMLSNGFQVMVRIHLGKGCLPVSWGGSSTLQE